MRELKTACAFLLGTIGGGAGAWFFLKDKYAKHSEQDIQSVKDAFRDREQKLEAKIKDLKTQLGFEGEPIDISAPTVLANKKVEEKEDVLKYATGRKYTQYTSSVCSETTNHSTKNDYVTIIPPYDYGEMEDYTKVTLSYYADGVLADEYGVIVDDVEEIVGDALNHFGEYEDDSVYCRNDQKKCDYAILKDLRRYADVRKTYPPNL